ncbi:metal-dependent hydrolase [Corynebacterium halotolerans]|uniref:Metal-dependent hydrolase n=1 Tax=Corynebacterium halotolerans YIM 70093 = DSM 44683 TaxID=1121362 RepID=M1N0G6_9CORY|nr:metal-dependent hydrolase [Corynebacterium halotolerans]AGF73454.1 hypothetical protein A605_12290 [Corynebacterium halotolerans YIM 70093 = DSM 44683]
MVMGPTHSMSGAAVGLAVAQAIPEAWGGVSSPQEAFVYAGIAAGAALLPDLDSPPATVSRSFGPLSQGLSHVVENTSQALVNLTRGRKDPRCRNGHRTATHTLWFALLTGAGAWGLIGNFGKPAAMSLLFVFLGLAIRGLLPEWSKKKDWYVVTAASALVALLAWRLVPTTASAAVMGSAVAVGVLTHLLGDAITKQGIPLLAPLIPLGGRRWWKFRPPGPLRVTASGPADKLLLTVFSVLVLVQIFIVASGSTVLTEVAPFFPGQPSPAGTGAVT